MEEKKFIDLLKKKITIPEIQREYVWGNYEDIVLQFIDDISSKIHNGEHCINIGFLYSYEKGVKDKENYLIDGQQRFTTLFLLLVYLYRISGITNDDKNYKLLYNFSFKVRPLTEQFILDLLNEDIKDFSIIDNEKWFVSDYKNDTSIKAICKLFEIFTKNKGRFNFTIDNILNDVYFYYFDVNNTSDGENLYITMNSRGEPLIDSEQLKPRLFSKLVGDENKQKDSNYYGKKWDIWEEFFFSHRPNPKKEVECVNNTLNNVIKICLELKDKNIHDSLDPINDIEKISLSDLEELMDIIRNDEFMKIINEQINNEESLFRILYKPNREGVLNKLYLLETYIIAWKKYKLPPSEFANHTEVQNLIYLIKNAINYKYVNHKNLLSFLVDFKDSDCTSVFNYVLSLENKVPEENLNIKVLKDNTSYIIPKLRAIQNNELGEDTQDKIREAENWAFFDGQIHFLYTEDNKIDKDSFINRFNNCRKYFDKNGFKNEDIKIKFMQAFYRRWIFAQDEYIFNTSVNTKEKYLRNNIIARPKYRKIMGYLLSVDDLTSVKNAEILETDPRRKTSAESIQKIADTNNTKILEFIFDSKNDLINGRVKWNSGHAIYKRYCQSNSIIYLDHTKRDQLLWELYDQNRITFESPEQIRPFLLGWDIDFVYKGKKYKFKYDNKVINDKKNNQSFKVDNTFTVEQFIENLDSIYE